MEERPISTVRRYQAMDVTDALAPLPVTDGFVWISCPHTTAGLILCESDEEMLDDVERVAQRLFAAMEPFRHHRNEKPNGAAHLMSAFLGSQLVMPVVDGALVLGTYQRVLFVELDGPRERTIHVAAMPGPGATASAGR